MDEFIAQQQAEEEAAMLEAAQYESYSYSSDYESSDTDFNGDANWFRDAGVIRQNGWRYTWYSEYEYTGGMAYGGSGIAGDDGVYRDADGYIMVAANRNDLGAGDVIDTPLGQGKVYDTGCSSGTIDIYTRW